MSALHQGFCSSCNKLIATDHPLNLCPECDIRLKTQSAKEGAWKQTPVLRRVAVRLLQGAALALGFVCLALVVWFLEPSYYRIADHPLAFCLLIAGAIAAYASYERARRLRRKIDASAETVVGWYTKRS
jgi:hypothetical protein